MLICFWRSLFDVSLKINSQLSNYGSNPVRHKCTSCTLFVVCISTTINNILQEGNSVVIAKQQRLTGCVSRHRDVWLCGCAYIADVEVRHWHGDVALDVRAVSQQLISHSRSFTTASATELNCGTVLYRRHVQLLSYAYMHTSACNCKKVLFYIQLYFTILHGSKNIST